MFKWFKQFRKYQDAKFVFDRMKGLCDWRHLDGCADGRNHSGRTQYGVGKCHMLHCPVLNKRK